MASKIQENMPVFIMSGVLLVYGLIAKTGALLPMMKYLSTHKTMDLQVTMCLIVAVIGIVGAVINSVREPGQTLFDRFFLQILGGIIMMLILAMAIRWYLEPLVIIWTKALEPVIGFNAYKILNLNYVVLGLLVGVIVTNTVGIPKFAAPGVKCARFVLKMGVIMLGRDTVLPSLQNLVSIVSGLSVFSYLEPFSLSYGSVTSSNSQKP